MMGIGMVAIVFVAIVLLVNVKECVDDDVEAQECSNAATVAAKFAKCPPPIQRQLQFITKQEKF